MTAMKIAASIVVMVPEAGLGVATQQHKKCNKQLNKEAKVVELLVGRKFEKILRYPGETKFDLCSYQGGNEVDFASISLIDFNGSTEF